MILHILASPLFYRRLRSRQCVYAYFIGLFARRALRSLKVSRLWHLMHMVLRLSNVSAPPSTFAIL